MAKSLFLLVNANNKFVAGFHAATAQDVLARMRIIPGWAELIPLRIGFNTWNLLDPVRLTPRMQLFAYTPHDLESAESRNVESAESLARVA